VRMGDDLGNCYVRAITLAFKASIEILLFQWSQVPEWKPNIDAWFKRFPVGVNF